MTSVDVKTWLRDLRALGAAAPIRAAYELSKRSGFHSILFSNKTPASPTSSTELRLTAVEPSSQQARQRCLADAEEIARAGVRVFGRRVHTGVHGRWSLDPLTGQTWPESMPWWKIDIRSDARMSDVKHVWEAGRHRDLVVLARASVIDPEGPWIDVLIRALTSWCDQCPPERGVHWYSSLELALRAVAWSQVLTLTRDRLPKSLVCEMERQLLASGRHFMVELPYTVSSMRNNHMLGDALGLLVLAKLFPALPAARRWRAVGDRLFNSQLARHMQPGGSMIEDSLSYHRFVVEMLIVRILLGNSPPEVAVALRGACEHLLKLGVFDGEIPQYGDWDEGRVLASSGRALDVAGSAALGLALTGAAVPHHWKEQYDELAWYAPDVAAPPPGEAMARSTSEEVDGHARVEVVGGFVHGSRGPWEVWFKVDGGPSHGHADLTSVWIKHRGQWIVSDPGTGTYNGSLAIRNGLRSSSAHPVIRPDGQDQLGPHRAFRWLRTARGHIAPATSIGARTVMFGWHDAYLGPMGIRVGRAIVMSDRFVAVVDSSHGDSDGHDLTVPLHPRISCDAGGLSVEGLEMKLFGMEGASDTRGQQSPFCGWHSDTYGDLRPTTWLTQHSSGRTHIWGFGDPGPVSQKDVAIDGLSFQFRWASMSVELLVRDHVTDREHSVGMAYD